MRAMSDGHQDGTRPGKVKMPPPVLMVKRRGTWLDTCLEHAVGEVEAIFLRDFGNIRHLGDCLSHWFEYSLFEGDAPARMA